MKKQICALAALAIATTLSACSTPARSSKLANLDGTAKMDDVAEVVSDIRRSEALQVMEVLPTEKDSPSAPTRKPVAYTVGMVEAFPLTNPLIDKIAETSVSDIAYKEQWTESETKNTIAKRAGELKKLTANQACFALRLGAPKANIGELKYWYGKLVQGDSARALKFYTEDERTLESFHTWERGSNKFSTSELYGRLTNSRDVVACATGKIDMTQPFKLVFEPRFERGIQKAELTWKRPRFQ